MDDDSQFSQYLSELDSPNTEGYTFFTKNETDGYSLEIYRKYEEVFKINFTVCAVYILFPLTFNLNASH